MGKGNQNDLDDERERLGLKKGDATSNAALGMIEGRVRDGELSPLAERLQRIQRIREEQHRRSQVRRQDEGPAGGDVA